MVDPGHGWTPPAPSAILSLNLLVFSGLHLVDSASTNSLELYNGEERVG